MNIERKMQREKRRRLSGSSGRRLKLSSTKRQAQIIKNGHSLRVMRSLRMKTTLTLLFLKMTLTLELWNKTFKRGRRGELEIRKRQKNLKKWETLL